MLIINHNKAIELEHIVCRLYKCDRGGISGLAEAGYFEKYPIQAAILVIAYIYAHGLETSYNQFDEFLYRYESAFQYPEQGSIEAEVKKYIDDLKTIADHYI